MGPDDQAAPAPSETRQHTQQIGGQAQISAAIAGDVHGPVSITTNMVAPAPRPTPRMAPPPPADFVARPAEYEQLIAALTSPQAGPVGICSALHGAGGYGKTTLAQAICQDARVRAAYPDGTLWVVVGEQPQSIPALVAKLIDELTGVRPALRTDDEAAIALDTALGERVCLLVIDDVWFAAHLRPFTHGAPNCTRLITTRLVETLPRSAKILPIEAMSPDQAVGMLQSQLVLTGALKERLAALAKQLGYWPLLLGLINGALREQVDAGATAQAALASIEQALQRQGITAFDPASPHAYRATVAGTIAVSLGRLPSRLRDRHAELAIFPGDTPIPLDTIAALWRATGGLTAAETEELCLRLVSRSLLRFYKQPERTFVLHDEMRGYLQREHQVALAGWHAALLDSLRPASPAPDQAAPTSAWADLPRGAAYVWDYLGYHLVAAGQGDALVATVLDMRYLLAKSAVRDVFAAEADIRRALGVAPAHPALIALERVVRLHSHILASCADSADRAATLLAYACHEPSLQPYLSSLAPCLDYPIFQPTSGWVSNEHPALLRTLSGHGDAVNSVALSADGLRALSGGEDDTLRLWDLATGQQLRKLEGHQLRVTSIALSADGSRALSGSDDGTLRQWDLATGQQLRKLEGHQLWVTSIALSADGSRALSGAADNTIRLWDLTTGQQLHMLKGHIDWVRSVTLSPDGSRALSGADDGTLRLWDLTTGRQLRMLECHQGAIWSVTLSADGSRALSGGRDGTLRLWDLVTGQQLRVLEGHQLTVKSVALSTDGSRALSGSADSTLRLWDIATGQQLLMFLGHGGVVNSVVLSVDGSRALSGGNDGTLRLWDLTSDQAPQPADHQGTVKSVALTIDGSRALSGGGDGTLRLWDIATGQQLRVLQGHTDWVTSVVLSADGSRALSGSDDGTLRLWDLATGQQLRMLESHQLHVTSVALLAGGSRALSGGSDGTLRLWDLITGQQLCVLEGHPYWARSVSLSAEGSLALSGGSDGTLRLWDLATIQRQYIRSRISTATPSWLRRRIFRPLRVLKSNPDWVTNVALSADGSLALSGGGDGMLRLWDLPTGKQLRLLEGHTNWIRSVALSVDGTRALSGSDDGTLRLWDLTSGRCQAIFRSDVPSTSCAWLPDGQAALVGDARGRVFVLRILTAWPPA